MTVILFILIFASVWALSIGKNLSTIKNYGLSLGWLLPALLGGPFVTMIHLVMIMSSDELKTKRRLVQMKTEQRLLEARMDEEQTLNKYLE